MLFYSMHVRDSIFRLNDDFDTKLYWVGRSLLIVFGCTHPGFINDFLELFSLGEKCERGKKEININAIGTISNREVRDSPREPNN